MGHCIRFLYRLEDDGLVSEQVEEAVGKQAPLKKYYGNHTRPGGGIEIYWNKSGSQLPVEYHWYYRNVPK